MQIYVQAIMTEMTVRHMQGEPMEKTLEWEASCACQLGALQRGRGVILQCVTTTAAVPARRPSRIF